MAAAGVLVVALIAVGLWLLGSHNSFTPSQERAPADGNAPNHTTRTSGPTPVTPVGEPIDGHHTPSATAPTSHPTRTTSDAAPPAATDNTNTPPTTTTNKVDEPPTSATSEPPTTSDAATTAPN
jgi:cytoskeletal protein RodZ